VRRDCLIVLDRPIFVVGCGRSGTTWLGTALGTHRSVAYLNEPRDMWFQAFPQSDIWSADSAARRGRIVLGDDDWNREGAEALHTLFKTATVGHGAARVCEKLPINAFRLRLIARVFPDARFVYIERDGIDVARSIAARIEVGVWYGVGDRKWDLLTDVAESKARTRGIARHCVTPLHKGLLEWVLSTTAARCFLGARPGRTAALRYDELLEAPDQVVCRIGAGCELEASAEPANFLRRTARPRPPRVPVALDDLGRELLACRADMVGHGAAASLLPHTTDDRPVQMGA